MSAPQTGQIVYRYDVPQHLGGGTTYSDTASASDSWRTTGVWHSLDPKSLAAIKDVLHVALALGKLTSPDAVMRELGLTPPEPKVG